jgi:hypothetical protein
MINVAVGIAAQVFPTPCASPQKAPKMVFALGPLSFNSVIARPPDDKHGREHLRHLVPCRATRTRSLPPDHHIGSPPGKVYEDIHRRDLLALGLFLSAAQTAEQAQAGQSNSQLADQV